MAILTIRNVPDEVHRALRVRAAKRNRSTEAEVRTILEDAVLSNDRIRLGSLLADVGRRIELTDEEFETFTYRDKGSNRPINFE